MRGAVALVRAAHPEPVATVTLIVVLLAAAAGRGALMTAVCGAAVLSGHLFVGWTNDALDATLDTQQGRMDKPIAVGLISRRAASTAAGIALAFAVPLSIAAGALAAVAHFAGLATATAYNVGLKRTPASVLAYAVAFAMLPAFVTLGPPVNHPPTLWATVAAALAGAGAHFTQALPDIERDRRSGVRGLPQRLGARLSALLSSALLLAAVAVVSWGAPTPATLVALAATALTMALTVASVVRGRLDLAFRATLLTALAVVVALVLAGGRF